MFDFVGGFYLVCLIFVCGELVMFGGWWFGFVFGVEGI